MPPKITGDRDGRLIREPNGKSRDRMVVNKRLPKSSCHRRRDEHRRKKASETSLLCAVCHQL